MIRVVGVRFKKAGKVYYFDPAEYPIAAGAKVVVETARGVEYGEVAVGPKDVTEDQVVQPLKRVLRIGNEKDAVVATENKRKEKEGFSVAQKKIESHALEMTLVDVEYTFDGSKIIFYFTAEGRVDFRELVRDLAGVFRTRIEMRQIGVRDEAKLLGGIGPCGRILCCTSFLGDFAPVSIRMAKDQNLSLNPSKISGLCGRLMCCLRYEQETYEAAKKDPTLAPGYVPPALVEAGADLEELEDRLVPAIGIRSPHASGVSARIAKAAGLMEKPLARAERAPERTDRQPPRQQGGARPQGQPSRAQGQPRREGEPRPQGERQFQQGPERRQSRPQQVQPRPEGGAERDQQGRPQPFRPQQQVGQPGQPPQQRTGTPVHQTPSPQAQGPRPLPIVGADERQEGGKEQTRSRNRRRRGGERPPQGDEKPPGGPNSQE
ncbi:MAG: putative signal peptidase [Firmicutes bacterium]|nr:putative signal peptidase [Bacillota bacterium]